MIVEQGSVRIDLLGGTLDIHPINLVLPNAYTLNLATSLKARVELKEIHFPGIRFITKDYGQTKEFKTEELNKANLETVLFGNFNFFVRILLLFSIKKNLEITLSSGSPPGAGLGGSSAMGITFYKAILKLLKIDEDKESIIRKIKDVEAILLDSGQTGYQDYYPALYGGVLALIPTIGGVKVSQLYSEKLKKEIEERMTLVFTGEMRFSGLNNWEVYKGFFNKNIAIRTGLANIAQYAKEAYNAIISEDWDAFFELIKKEGEEREKLFPQIVVESQRKLLGEIRKDLKDVGMKVCGAGGGGCFILIHKNNEFPVVEKHIKSSLMSILDFTVEKPI